LKRRVAELDVVHVVRDRGAVPTNRAIRVAAHRDLVERRPEGVEEEEAPGECVTAVEASLAWIEPMIPGRTPRTPPSAQLGASSGGGGWGYRHR
jgi:hypothetical protein